MLASSALVRLYRPRSMGYQDYEQKVKISIDDAWEIERSTCHIMQI